MKMTIFLPATGSRLFLLHELIKAVAHVCEHLISKAWVNADPEGVGHYPVSILQPARNPELHVLIGRLLCQVACKKQPCRNAARLEVRRNLIAHKARLLAHSEREAERARAGLWL